jgi:hypothetical protein
MHSDVSFQAIPILIDGHDTQGQLVLVKGDLVAVLARLDGESHDPEVKRHWHLEAGFGPCREVPGRVFTSLDEAGAWASEQVEAKQRASRR